MKLSFVFLLFLFSQRSVAAAGFISNAATEEVFSQRIENRDAQCPPAEYGAVLSYGDSCQQMCHCLGNEQCDHVTGECSSGCAPGWAGTGCQYANLALHGLATQRQTDESEPVFKPESAVDGNVSTCTKTLHDEPRWCVNLGTRRNVVGLNIIVPQRDPVSLDSYIIYISNVSYAASEKELGICYWQDKPLPGDVTRTKYEIMCYQPLIGQFLIIHKRKPVKSELELCEVQVYGGRELGFRKPSAQSSTFQDQKTGAYKAVNGRAVDTDILQCSATQEADNPAWMVDLGMLYKIHRLVLHNLEINGTRALLIGFVVMINKASPSARDYVYSHEESYINQTTEVNILNPVVGRYVTIRLPGQNKQLVLCEVDIFGDCPTNQCGNDCSASCWCNNTITGDAQLRGTCPFKCSEDVDPNSMPMCEKAHSTSLPTSTSTPSPGLIDGLQTTSGTGSGTTLDDDGQHKTNGTGGKNMIDDAGQSATAETGTVGDDAGQRKNGTAHSTSPPKSTSTPSSGLIDGLQNTSETGSGTTLDYAGQRETNETGGKRMIDDSGQSATAEIGTVADDAGQSETVETGTVADDAGQRKNGTGVREDNNLQDKARQTTTPSMSPSFHDMNSVSKAINICIILYCIANTF